MEHNVEGHEGHKQVMKKLMVTNITVSILTLILLIGNYFMTYHTIMKVEYQKVGSKENYELISKVQMQQIQQMIDYYNTPEGKAQLGEPFGTNTNSSPKVIDDISAIKADYFVEGNPDADITWIEYSDLECPFCKKLFDSKAKDNIVAKYNGKVNYMFKHFPLDFHQNAQKESEALECAGEQKGGEAYFAMMSAIFTKTTSNGTGFPLDGLPTIAEEIGLDVNAFNSCLESGKYTQKVLNAMSEGQKYDITGTPGTLLVNNKTGQYEVISGAQAESSFDAAIKRLLGE